MKKKHKEYLEKYGNIPNDFVERFNFIIKELKLNMKHFEEIKKAIKKLRNREKTKLNFVFYFIPQATPRARYSRFTRAFYVKNASDNSSLFKEFIESCNDLYKVITTPCSFHCEIFMPIPNQMNKIEKVLAELKMISALSKPDWDNLGKTYSDMVQKYLILDDCLIHDASVKKFYSFKPRIEIEIEFMQKYDCKYNKKKVEKWKTYQDSIQNIEEKDAIV